MIEEQVCMLPGRYHRLFDAGPIDNHLMKGNKIYVD